MIAPRCAACHAVWNADSQPPVQTHTCPQKGPKSRVQVLAAIATAARELYFSFSAGMPGGNYVAKEELDHLIYRLAVMEHHGLYEERVERADEGGRTR